MERKGITPVIAVVLLIAVTIGGSATIYEVFISTQNQAQQFEPDINLNSDSLSIESCWNQSNTVFLSVRNEASEAINSTRIPLQVGGESIEYLEDYGVDEEIVSPQQGFRIEFYPSTNVDNETRINILASSETIQYRCWSLPTM